MIDYRIVCPTRSRSLFFAILSSLFSAVCCQFWQFVPFVLCVGLSDDMLVYCQRCKGNPLQKKIKKKKNGRRKEEKDAGITHHSCRNAAQMSFYFIVLTNTQQSQWQPFDVLFIDSSWVPLHLRHLRILFAFNSRRLAIFTSP